MSKAVTSVTIDEDTFSIVKLDVDKALKVLIWLTKSVGGSLSGGLGELSSLGKSEGDIDLSKFSTIFEKLFEKIDEKETLEKVEILLSCVSYKTINLNFSSPILHGNPLLALKLAKESLAVNFKSFLGGISGIGKKLKESAAIIAEGAK